MVPAEGKGVGEKTETYGKKLSDNQLSITIKFSI